MAEKKLENKSFNSFDDNEYGNYIKEVVTPLGDVYIINEKTNEKFIKGTQRRDGTFRKSIRVRTDYMPQEENCAYKVKAKLAEERNQNNNKIFPSISTRNEGIKINNVANKIGEKKIPGWNPVEDNVNNSANNLKKKKKKKNIKNHENGPN
ncbi:hypothetical protein YYC_03932 [Plasmodium yoelii 17X]|uniref:Mago-binding protein n=4 Tax=Plasmodium yoelii TaxID=5861 RepID=A0AAE9WRV8_PLAYO|nr:mago-binding protein, putative [Plasmodium yoelii]EAA18957.1 hypothetical protein [Plasmodium yoelii yoelii]ETB58295.1 hypothetical protein YYC_03932 [Plasmodium yoelii 17X]WBY55967.1 mago-binding protein [Plasmodium yoelii yoelii]CDU16954.1 conserved Plasmodium protein, unknown function [Plasmodium yoelii]VTZ75282.1 mago-binding protein, putative [Plasmodium yoelii]|eukprot:XP_727392.1 mago-binding protein, putative [Plasmodium yoelii]